MQAVLTESWNEPIAGAQSAASLCGQLQHNQSETIDTLIADSIDGQQTLSVMGLDDVFRRRQSGFSAIKKLVTTLILCENELQQHNISMRCGCNALVYAFLTGAKNFDFIIPESDDRTASTFRKILPVWKSTIQQLESFEREGKSLSDAELKETYLQIRPIMIRSSARDEHRVLTTLLMSGPSTLEDISRDLRLPYTLSERVAAPFISAGIVDKSTATDCTSIRYGITRQFIPLVLFLARETLGVDPLSVLEN